MTDLIELTMAKNEREPKSKGGKKKDLIGRWKRQTETAIRIFELLDMEFGLDKQGPAPDFEEIPWVPEPDLLMPIRTLDGHSFTIRIPITKSAKLEAASPEINRKKIRLILGMVRRVIKKPMVRRVTQKSTVAR